jgi:hypothetical protein
LVLYKAELRKYHRILLAPREEHQLPSDHLPYNNFTKKTSPISEQGKNNKFDTLSARCGQSITRYLVASFSAGVGCNEGNPMSQETQSGVSMPSAGVGCNGPVQCY